MLTGLLGVGGGFIIVPALVTFRGMKMQRGIGTSLVIITLISLTGASGGENIANGPTVEEAAMRRL